MAIGRLRIARCTSIVAPLALIIGFVVGAARQPSYYDSVRDTISALASRGAVDRWVMTTALVVLGVCHLISSYALSRPLLAIGGLCTVGLAFAPEPAVGSSTVHGLLATVAFVALAVWALPQYWQASAFLVVLVLVFWIVLQTNGWVGLTERIAAVAEALFPIYVVWREHDRVARQTRFDDALRRSLQ
jgi:hypothetical membrane protein